MTKDSTPVGRSIIVTELILTTTVLPDGKIEISAPELIPGQYVTVIVKISELQLEKRTIEEHLARAHYDGDGLFKTEGK